MLPANLMSFKTKTKIHETLVIRCCGKGTPKEWPMRKNKQGLALEVSGTQIPAGLSGYSVHCEVEEGYQP